LGPTSESSTFDEVSESGNQDKIKYLLKDYFDIDFAPGYLYLLSYDHLEKCTKRDEYSEYTINIMSKCVDSLNVPTEELNETVVKDFLKSNNNLKALNDNKYKFAYGFIKTLNWLRNYLKIHYEEESNDFFKKENKNQWKTIGWLKLSSFYSLYQIFVENFEDNNRQIISSSDLKGFNAPANYNSADHSAVTTLFDNWKTTLKNDANKVLSNLVTFTDKNDNTDKREKALEDFKERQCNTILKSEPVEKNDGKAGYILRRLFKAYIANSHQLPDLGLRYILISLINDKKRIDFLESEKKACKEILDKLKKTTSKSTRTNDELKKIWETGLLNFEINDIKFKKLEEHKSNEIKAALGKRKKLAAYFQELVIKQENIKQKLNSEEEEDKFIIKRHLRELRAILDNSILNKTLYWESILTRGICDYIASLTDQEAVNEYEKLYAGIMELV